MVWHRELRQAGAAIVRLRDSTPSRRSARQPSGARPRHAFPELDCVRDRLSPRDLAEAERRAERLGTGADRVLIANGGLDEERYVRALAAHFGLPFDDLVHTSRAACPLTDRRLIDTAQLGLTTLASSEGADFVIAPRHLAARTLAGLVATRPELAKRFRLTTTGRLDSFALRVTGRTLGELAAHGLRRQRPHLSAAALPGARAAIRRRATITGVIAACALALWTAPFVVEGALALFFLAWLALRFATALTRRPRTPLPAGPADRDLPLYTIVVALYREARSVDGLLNAIARLDYPPEKLDVILAIEADDEETREAIAKARCAQPPRVIEAPAGAPRTKPRALNAALPFARGSLTVVYDAEDRPEPDQLRRAVEAFAAGDGHLACVQARLSIDNTEDGWLARMFTAEYAGQFDVFLDGLCALGVPLPLGGSSNHFATGALRDAGAWDAWNVTEDADLGLRLARFGYRTAMIDSTTYEEAPAHLFPWLRQRTRWFKGWMQTWCVHMRQPLTLWRELGPRGFLGFQFAVGGNVLAALVHPLFLLASIVAGLAGSPLWEAEDGAAVLAALYGLSLLTGYASSGVLGTIGLARRGLLHHGWVLLMMPVHWLLLSLAAWRALYQVLAAPYVWEKTEHGLAKHSRRATRLAQSLRALEREIAALQAEGLIGEINTGERRATWRARAQR